MIIRLMLSIIKVQSLSISALIGYYSRPDMNTGWCGKFEFLTKEQQIEEWLK